MVFSFSRSYTTIFDAIVSCSAFVNYLIESRDSTNASK